MIARCCALGDENPIDRFISLRTSNSEQAHRVRVTGVLRTLPSHSHFTIDFLGSIDLVDLLHDEHVL